MANIQYNESTPESTGAATFSLNPYAWEPPAGRDINSISILHGANTYHESYWDSRTRTLVWSHVYATAAYDTIGFTTQFTTMKSWEGNIVYFNFQSMADMNDNWPNANTWKKARVIKINASYRSADQSGIPMYERVELVIQPEI